MIRLGGQHVWYPDVYRGEFPPAGRRRPTISRAGCPCHARGAALLEVIISMGLLLFAMAVVGMQINTGLAIARTADQSTRAVMLTNTKWAELKSGVLVPQVNQQDMKGDFGILYPGYTWRMFFKPTDIPNWLMITLEIGFNQNQVQDKITNPEKDLDFEDAATKIIQTSYRLMPTPAQVNLQDLLPFDPADVDNAMAAQAVAQAGDAAQGGDDAAAAGNAAAAAGLTGMSDLIKMLQDMMQGGSFDPRMLASLPPDQFAQLAPIMELFLGRSPPFGKDSNQLIQQLMQQFGVQGGGAGGHGGPHGPGGQGPPGPGNAGPFGPGGQGSAGMGGQGPGGTAGGSQFGQGGGTGTGQGGRPNQVGQPGTGGGARQPGAGGRAPKPRPGIGGGASPGASR